MATSGTVAQTEVLVETLISHAIQRCGKLPSTAGGELLAKVREALYFQIADLGNTGINLWCISKSVVNVVANQVAYQLPVGTNKISDMLYRTLTSLPGTLSTAVDAQIFTCSTAQAVDNITGRFTAPGVASIAIEYLDTVSSTWKTLSTLNSVTVVAGAVFVIDLDTTALAVTWRIRDTSGTILAMDNVYFRKANTELPMSRLNRNDYANLPNKHYPGSKSLQYWFDKQIEPRVWLWPVSNQPLDQIVIWAAIEIQDPGDLTNKLSVPTRWYQSVMATLAYNTAFLIPPAELPPGRLADLKMEAAEALGRASDGESDGSSYQLAPRISGYTK